MVKTLGRDIKRAEFRLENMTPAHSWQHPRNTAAVTAAATAWAGCAHLHPAVAQKLDKKAAVVCAQLDMDAFAALPALDYQYREPSKFPGIDMDLSLLLPDGMRFADMEPAWADVDPALLTGVSLIDLFDQNGKRSITLRFAFSSQEKTLSKEEGPACGGCHRGETGPGRGRAAGLKIPARDPMTGKVREILAIPPVFLYHSRVG